MRQYISLLLIIIVVAIGPSFGGMSFMDHSDHMMAMGTCAIESCSDVRSGAVNGMDCVAHCLQVASTLGSSSAPGIVQFVFTLIVAAVFLFSISRGRYTAILNRSDRGIARLLLHRQLATVVIRD